MERKIPAQLQNDSFGFVKLKPKSKIPFEQDWQNKPYPYTDIESWFSQGANYGVLGGQGDLIVIDADTPAMSELVSSKIPATFTVKTPRPGHHFYFFCPEIKKKIVLKKDNKHLGEIISTGSQVVGPGSIHPDTGTEYKVIHDIEIATITREEVFSALVEYIPQEFPQKDTETEISDLRVLDVLEKAGVETKCVGSQLAGGHPVHGSTNGSNFVVSPDKNVWHCFRCDSGGGAIALIAVLEKVIDCHEAVRGGLRGDKFKETLRIAGEKYGFEIKRERGAAVASSSFYSGSTAASWPDPLAQEALHGLAGDVVRAIEPYSEADPVALLVHFLAEFGCIVGRNPHVQLDGAYNPLLFWPVLVGDTAKSRKGSANKRIGRIFKAAFLDWTRGACRGSLSSGEGLVFAVRDEMRNMKGELIDEGISDKRLFLVQAEFGSMLRVMSREGNSLSGVIRDAWDGEDLAPMTKNSRIQATWPHIAIVGHVTKDELLRNLTGVEMANGFANRFAWFAVRRSKFLPFANNPPEEVINPLVARLHAAITFAQAAKEVTLTPGAAEVWGSVYPDLSGSKPGMVDDLLARSESQARRIAALYTLLDQKTAVDVVHLEATLALWDYAEDSTFWIFGDATGDPVADTILRAVRTAGEMDDTAISTLFSRHLPAGRLSQGKDRLLKAELIYCDTVVTAGRPRLVWKPSAK